MSSFEEKPHFAPVMSASTAEVAAAGPGRRRVVYAVLVAISCAGLSSWLAILVRGNEAYFLDSILILAAATKIFWVASVFWNALIGFVLRHATDDPAAQVYPGFARALGNDPISSRTAIVMTIRDEDTNHVFANLQAIKASVDASGFGDKFKFYLLSDSVTPEAIAAESRGIEALQIRPDFANLVYRHREKNVDFKAGNLREFCDRWGHDHEFMVVLDADSLMAGDTIVALVRVMQGAPRLGILQSTIDCVSPPLAAARIFEFGHRHVWRNYILGSAWWQGARGQYRGHNALIRIAAYMNHARFSARDARLSRLQHIMCFDQVEAALLHRAGFEIREWPTNDGSYEGMPPAVPDFLIRYQRWCQGNLANVRLLALPGLQPMDRFHLLGVAQRFLGWPASVAFVALAAYVTISWPQAIPFPATSAMALYAIFAFLYFIPRILGLIDAALAGPDRYGGLPRLLLGGLIEIAFTMLFVPIAMISVTWFMIRLIFGHRSQWLPQRRSEYRSEWTKVAVAMWPPTAFGLGLAALLAAKAPSTLPWFAPFLSGPVVSVPFCVLMGSRRISATMQRFGLCAMPEEIAPPRELAERRRLELECEER
jgi:membrane glycosyltransferase